MSKLIFYPIAVEQAALVQHRACETAKAMDRRLPPQPHAIEDVEHMVSGDSSRLGRLHGAQIAPDFPVGKGTVQRTEFLQQSQSLPRQRDKTLVAWLHPLIGNATERIRAANIFQLRPLRKAGSLAAYHGEHGPAQRKLTHACAWIGVEHVEESGQLPNRNSGAVFYRSGFRQENVSERIRFAISL